MLMTTRYSPDTCGCVVEYTWDSTTTEATRVHTPAAVIVRCARHAAFVDLAGHFQQLFDENPRKNKLLAKAQSLYPQMFDAQGNFLGSWSFDASHVLHITTVGLTTNQKTNIQTWCDTNLGVGKVVIT